MSLIQWFNLGAQSKGTDQSTVDDTSVFRVCCVMPSYNISSLALKNELKINKTRQGGAAQPGNPTAPSNDV